MFGTIRKHSQALWIPIIIVIVISFVVYFTPGYDPFEDQGPSQSKTDAELSFARQQVLLEAALNMSQRFNGFLPPQITAQAIAAQFPDKDLNKDRETDVSGLDYQAHLRVLRLNKAKSLGIITSANMIKARLEQMFTNPNDKKFSTQAYNNFLNQYRGNDFLAGGDAGEDQFQELIREQITFQQMDQLMSRSVGFFSNQATAAQQAEENKKYTAQVVFFTTSNRVSEVTNFASIATNYYQKVSGQYFLQPKRKVAFVLFPVGPHLAEAEKQIKLDDLVKARINVHLSSTNTIDHLKDANGTKLEAGAKLDAAALVDVYQRNQTNLDAITLPKAKKQATLFQQTLDSSTSGWTIAGLQELATKQEMKIGAAMFSEANEQAKYPQALIDAAFAMSESDIGKLSEGVAVKVSGEGYYVFGLEEVISGRPRKYIELSKNEQAEVKKGFINEEVKRLASEEGGDWREAVAESMAEGATFSNTVKLSKHAIAELPPMTITERDVNATTLKGLANLSDIQSVISNLEWENRSAAKPNWLSIYNASITEGVGGFIVHVSKLEKGDAPSDTEVQEFANNQRERTRSFNSSLSAARFGITPAWLKGDVEALNQQLIVSALTQRLKNIGYDIEQASSEVSELEKVITKAKSNPSMLSGSVTLEDLESDLIEAKNKLEQLRALQKTLPEKLKATQQPAAQN